MRDVDNILKLVTMVVQLFEYIKKSMVVCYKGWHLWYVNFISNFEKPMRGGRMKKRD